MSLHHKHKPIHSQTSVKFTARMSTIQKSPSKRMKTMDPQKLELKNIREQQRRIKPGECLKFVRVLIDPECLCAGLGPQILQKLGELGIKYEVQSQKIPRTVLWERAESQTLASSSEMLKLSDKYIRESQALFIMLGEEVIEAIKNKSMHNQLQSLTKAYPNCSITLLIFGLKKFCRQESTNVKRYDIEKCLTEIQIIYNCSHRLFETSVELAAAIGQFSKAIAEIPFKKQQADKYSDANLFLSNDNKDCVRVEGTAGLSRLWQQHLTRLPLVTLETAEAIISKYPKPKQLLEAYETCDDGQNLLADLKIRRAGGPLTTDRRIGTELSRKIYTLYNSLDPNEKL